jgi:hypothetical protein
MAGNKIGRTGNRAAVIRLSLAIISELAKGREKLRNRVYFKLISDNSAK